MTQPRLVLITNDSPHGQRVLQALYERGVGVQVLFTAGSFGPPALKDAGLLRRLLRWPRAVAGTVRRTVRFNRHRRRLYAERSAGVRATGLVNSARLLRDLRRLAPDWIILGGGGIVSDAVIRSARVGVLNAHPALLPWIRGTGVTGASLVHGVALGATVHRVDEGIDTGPVIARRLATIPPHETDLGALEQATMELAAAMLGDVVERVVRGESPSGTPQPERYPLQRWPADPTFAEHRALAAALRAQALDAAWRPLCVDRECGVLPDGPVEAPDMMTLRPRS